MDLTVLHTEGCPHLAPLLDDLRALVAGRADVTITTHAVLTPAEAEAVGFHGSPTLLIDGRDPFPAGTEVGLACRVYPGEDWTTRGHPTRRQLEAVLG